LTIRRSARSTADRSPCASGRLAAEAARTAARQGDRAGRWEARASRPVEPSLSGEGSGARCPAREGARRRGVRRLRAADFGRATSRALPVRAGTRNEAPQGPRFQEQTASRQRQADEATRVLRKEPQGTALVAALSRGSYGRPQGRHEVKSPRHLQLRWRPSDSSDGGEAGCPSALVAPGPPGSKRWVSAPSSGMHQVPGFRCGPGDASSSSRGRRPRPERPTPLGEAEARIARRARTTGTSGTIGPSSRMGEDSGFDGRGAE
jgi:hypothetical protein